MARETLRGWGLSRDGSRAGERSGTPGAAEGAGEAQGVPAGSVPQHFYPTAAQVLGMGACNYYKPMNIKGNCLFLSPVKTVNVFKALNVKLAVIVAFLFEAHC